MTHLPSNCEVGLAIDKALIRMGKARTNGLTS